MKEHRWAIVVVYEVTPEEAATVVSGDVVHLHAEKRLGIDGPGCLDCEEPYEVAATTSCNGLPGGPAQR